jgi:Lipid A 3-O-deacylase (PagL)
MMRGRTPTSSLKPPHPEGSFLRKAAIVTIFAAFTSICCPPVHSQEDPLRLDTPRSFGFSTTLSNDSSHILIGDSERRRIWSLGAEYSRLLRLTPRYRLDYQASIMPLYEETDPTIYGTAFTLGGQTFTTLQTPMRVVYAVRGPVGTIGSATSPNNPIIALTAREDTYAAAITPLGARISALPRHRIQPSLALDLGFLVSQRDIPIEDSSQFNFMFTCGPGLDFITAPHASLRIEYLYRHTSNAGLGSQNPGVDQGVARVTLSRRW